MQIGPRIRVGGTLGKVGQNVKIGVGKVASKAAPVVGLFNPGLGTALSLAGNALDTTDGKFDIGHAVKDAALSYGSGKALSVLGKLPGASKVSSALHHVPGGDKLGSVIQSTFPQGSMQAGDEQLPPVQIGTNPDGTPRYNPGQAPGAPQAGEEPGRFRRVMDFLSNHKDDIFDYGAAAEGIYDKYRQSKMQDEGLDLARGDFARRAPLRSAGMAGLLDNSRPDISSVFSDPQNPTGRYRTVNVGSRR